MITVPIINESPYDRPSFATVNSAGVDLRENSANPITLGPLENVKSKQ